MLKELISLIPPEALKLFLVLFLSFLTGLEREERRTGSQEYAFGGVRAFPLIGLTGYTAALLSDGSYWIFSSGFLAISGLMMLSYRHKVELNPVAGVTTEISGLLTYALGGLVFKENYWIASTVVILSLLLLELKNWLENLSQRIAASEILTFTKFLLLTVVILPVFPNQAFGPYEINPYKTWVVVSATSAISYASYLIRNWAKGRGGLLLTAVLGGAYSSTVSTVVLAKKARAVGNQNVHQYSGAILAASGMMYLRLAILVFLFNAELFRLLSIEFSVLALIALGGGALWSLRRETEIRDASLEVEATNPLELHTAFLFAIFFLLMLVVSKFALEHFGRNGVYGLAGVMGLTDVDPFIMSMTQAPSIHLSIAAVSIVIAAASNNALKGGYAYFFARGKTGRESATLLFALALLGALPLVWIG